MTILNSHRFNNLSREEVLRRIGELLAIAIGRLAELVRLKSTATPPRAPAHGSAAAKSIDPTPRVDDALERQIVVHLYKVGAATPRELIAMLGFTRRAITRNLARLRAAGLCQVDGRIRMACYRLRSKTDGTGSHS